MKEVVKDKWVAALRSGNYEQASGVLYDGKGYCCLGVLCDVMGLKPEQHDTNFSSEYTFGDESGVLPPAVMEKAGIRFANGGYAYARKALSHDNDRGKSFNEIADIIEANWKDL